MSITGAHLAGKTKPQHRGNGLGQGTNNQERPRFMTSVTEIRKTVTTTCDNGACDLFQREHTDRVDTDGTYQVHHKVAFGDTIWIDTFDDQPWVLFAESPDALTDPVEILEFAKNVAAAAALAADLNKPGSRPQDVLSDNVRAAIHRFHRRPSAAVLRGLLEVNEARARALYFGRTSYTLGELELLNVYFNVDKTNEWFRGSGPVFRRFGDVVAAEDRIVTYREEHPA